MGPRMPLGGQIGFLYAGDGTDNLEFIRKRWNVPIIYSSSTLSNFIDVVCHIRRFYCPRTILLQGSTVWRLPSATIAANTLRTSTAYNMLGQPVSGARKQNSERRCLSMSRLLRTAGLRRIPSYIWGVVYFKLRTDVKHLVLVLRRISSGKKTSAKRDFLHGSSVADSSFPRRCSEDSRA